MLCNVKIDSDLLSKLISDRLDYMLNNKVYYSKVKKLYMQMYDNMIDGGVFESAEFDPRAIVDNDLINYCDDVTPYDERFSEVLKVYKAQGLGDCSCEIDGISFIEAVDDKDNPTMFLIRY